MPLFKIPVTWVSEGEYEVQADSLQTAISQLLNTLNPSLLQSPWSKYVEGTLSVDFIKARKLNKSRDPL